MTQFARPDADQSFGGWTIAPLWSKIDEDISGGGTGDGATIQSSDNTVGDTCDIRLSDVQPPSGGTITAFVRWNKSASGGHTINGVCEVWEGVPGVGTMRGQGLANNISEVEAATNFNVTGITDYTNLYVRFIRNGSSGGSPGSRRSLVVEAFQLEVPDALTLKTSIDSPTVALSEAQASTVASDRTDTTPVSVAESAIPMLPFQSDDPISIGVQESAEKFIAVFEQSDVGAPTFASVSGGTTGSGEATGQSFQLDSNVSITHIQLFLKKDGDPTDSFIVQVLDTDIVTGNILYSQGIDAEDIPSGPGWFLIQLSPELELSSGVTYFLRLTRSGPRDVSDDVEVGHSTSDVYAGGTRYVRTLGNWNTATGDLALRLYGTASVLSLVTGSDDSSVGVTEGASQLAVIMSQSDSPASGLTEVAALLVGLTPVDEPATSVDEAQASLIAIDNAADTPTVTAVETSSSMLSTDIVDNTAVSVEDVSQAVGRADVSDDTLLSTAEAASSLVSSDRLDDPSLVLTEEQSSLIAIDNCADTPTAAVTEQVEVGVTVESSDDPTLQAFDLVISNVMRADVSDDLALTVDEALSLLSRSDVSDDVLVSLSEQAENLLSTEVSEVITASVQELSLIGVTLQGSDELNVSLQEASDSLLSIEGVDDIPVLVDEESQNQLFTDLTDEPALQLVETVEVGQSAVEKSGSDSPTLSVEELSLNNIYVNVVDAVSTAITDSVIDLNVLLAVTEDVQGAVDESLAVVGFLAAADEPTLSLLEQIINQSAFISSDDAAIVVLLESSDVGKEVVGLSFTPKPPFTARVVGPFRTNLSVVRSTDLVQPTVPIRKVIVDHKTHDLEVLDE